MKWPWYFVTHYNHAFWSIGPLILLFFVIITYLCINWIVSPSWRRQWGLWWWGMAVVWWRWECSMPNWNLPSSKSLRHGEFSRNLYPTVVLYAGFTCTSIFHPVNWLFLIFMFVCVLCVGLPLVIQAFRFVYIWPMRAGITWTWACTGKSRTRIQDRCVSIYFPHPGVKATQNFFYM